MPLGLDIARLGVRIDTKESVTELKKGERAVKDFGDTTDREVGRARKAFTAANAALAAFAAALVAVAATAVRNAIRTFIQFSASISELSAITGAAGEDLKFLSDAAKEMGRTTTFSATQAAEAFKLMASAKPDLLENLDALKETTQASLTLAEAAGLDLPSATQILGQALNQFSARAEEANRFINVLAAGAQKGASEIFDTAQALLQSGTVAAAANISFELLNASIQTLAEVGIKGARAGTALRNVFLILESSTEDALRPSVVGLSAALEELDRRNLSAAELTKLFGRENVVAGQQLAGNVDTLRRYTDALTGTNTATEQASTRLDNLQGDLKRLGSAYEALEITLGEALEDPLRRIVQLITEVLQGFDMMVGGIIASLGQIKDYFLLTFNTIKLAWLETLNFLPDFMAEKIKEMLNISADAQAKVLEDQVKIIQRMRDRFRAETPVIEITGGGRGGPPTIPPPPGGGSLGEPGFGEGGRQARLNALYIEKITEQREALNQAEKDAQTIINRNKTEYERYNEELGKALDLYNKGVLSADELDREIVRLNKSLKDSTKNLSNDMQASLDIISNSVRHFGDDVTEFFVDFARTGKFAFDDFTEAVLADITRMVVRITIVEPIVRRFVAALQGAGTASGGGGFASFFEALFGAAVSSGGSTYTPTYGGGFQTGGSFLVGGAGGPDSQLVAFRATPGERVDVTPRTSPRGDAVPVNVTFNLQSLDPSNAADVVRSTLPQLEQEIVGTVQNAYNVRGSKGPLG